MTTTLFFRDANGNIVHTVNGIQNICAFFGINPPILQNGALQMFVMANHFKVSFGNALFQFHEANADMTTNSLEITYKEVILQSVELKFNETFTPAERIQIHTIILINCKEIDLHVISYKQDNNVDKVLLPNMNQFSNNGLAFDITKPEFVDIGNYIALTMIDTNKDTNGIGVIIKYSEVNQ